MEITEVKPKKEALKKRAKEIGAVKCCPEFTLKSWVTEDLHQAPICSSGSANKFFQKCFNPDTIAINEEFIVVYLNRAGKPLGWYRSSRGGMTSTVVDIRLILSVALSCGATGMILSHNHPTGNLNCSPEDKKATRKIKEAAKLMDIAVLDHIIVIPGGGYCSLADDKLM